VSHPHPELGTPPPLPETALRIVGLGGLGEIGRNMTVFEYQGRLLIVDCGVLFPEPDQPGVDLILPDFTSLEGRLGQIEAMVLTHAHEDHIGAVPYLLRQRADIPLVGSRLTLGLVRSKLTEHRITPAGVEVAEGGRLSFGPFELEFFAVNHSIPDAMAVAITTPAGVVLHTGDFKMDQLPLDGRLTDLGGFARIGSAGVDLLMSDSTNAEIPGIVTSEREISPVLNEMFGSTQQRIIVACFASHVHRVQQVLDAAAAHGRKVAFVGRSMVRNMGVARDLGYLRVPSVRGGLLVDPRDAESMPPGEVVLVCTGSQGEPMSALSRMAGRDHPIRIAEGDTVILASSLIPGNESAVYRVINELTRWGARVVHKGNALVHVSGHAPAGELLYVLNLVKPRNFMPVHGEWRHLRAHARLAELTGIPHRNVVIAEDGVVVDLVDGKASVVGKVPCGYVYVDGLSVGEVTETSLKDRRILGEEGFLSVVIVVDSTTGKLAASPAIHARGSGIDDSSLMEVRPRIEEVLARAAEDGINDAHQLGQLVRRTVGRWVNDTYRRRPMIIPVVIEV
jgi:ribonuclease J